MEAAKTSQLNLKNATGHKDSLCRTCAHIIRNVPYDKQTAQVLDIYLPHDRLVSSTKILVIIHGGGFNSGTKMNFQLTLNLCSAPFD